MLLTLEKVKFAVHHLTDVPVYPLDTTTVQEDDTLNQDIDPYDLQLDDSDEEASTSTKRTSNGLFDDDSGIEIGGGPGAQAP